MKISVAHARGAKGNWYHLDLPEPITAAEALRASPVFQHYPDLDLETHRYFWQILYPRYRVESRRSSGNLSARATPAGCR